MMEKSLQEIRERVRLIDSKLSEGHAFIGAFPMMRHPHINCGCFWGARMLGVLDVPVKDRRDASNIKVGEEAWSDR